MISNIHLGNMTEVLQTMIFVGFKIMEDDHDVYLKRNMECFIILSLNVDDILLARNKLKIYRKPKVGCHAL